ncbi:hypothetical protein SLS62_004111 [Diatrype stigma]|uniref:Up-regulated during septation protein 1 domain-containing protein n=1 Tax=Diatrype stigma TaxID=117547 RepID=A0AAN9UVM2_9PEZI
MAQPEPRKYQLFPKDRLPAPPVIVRQLENEPPVPVPVASTTEKSEKSSIASDLRQRIKEHNLNRRRKISVQELGPMTTVQEVPMDSPRKKSTTRLKANGSHQDLANLPSKVDESPKTRTPFTPYTPMSGCLSNATPRSATTAMTASSLPTPISAPADRRASPHPWDKPVLPSSDTGSRQAADATSIPKSETRSSSRSPPAGSHKRNQSDSGSIMERGRPRRRYDGSTVGGCHKRCASKRSVSNERQAFETLPQGWKSSEAASKMDQAEINHLKKQAIGQALRFEVLRKEDVEAKFSYESMLKQEEALAELDASIDDWVNKLEHAENRRTRVRQKLLEHVAAAAALWNTTDSEVSGAQLPAVPGSDLSTPPQSPSKASVCSDCGSPPSPSPQRVVARVPSVIPELPGEEEDSNKRFTSRDPEEQSALKRMESIRIYADSDVYKLLADVESEFTEMNGQGVTSPGIADEKRALHRAHSHDVLMGSSKTGNTTTTTTTITTTTTQAPNSPAPSPSPSRASPKSDEGLFLTAAVFKPE